MKKLLWLAVCALMAFGSLLPVGVSAQSGDDPPQPPPPGITIQNVTLSCTGLVTFNVANPNDIGANRQAYISIYRITELFGGGDFSESLQGQLFLLTQGQASYSYQFSNGSTWSENYQMDKIYASVGDNGGNSNFGRSETLSCFTGPPLAPTTYTLDSAMCDGTGRVTVTMDPRLDVLYGYYVAAFDADTGALAPGTQRQTLNFSFTQSQSFSLGSLAGTKNVVVNFQGIHQGETDLTKGSSIELDCYVPVPEPPITPGDPAPNSFQVTSYNRVCTDDSFRMTWTGTNLSRLTYFFVDQDNEYGTPRMYVLDPSVGSLQTSVDLANWGAIVVWPKFTNGDEDEWKTYWVEPCGTPIDPSPSPSPTATTAPVPTATAPVPTATQIPDVTPTPVPNTFALTSAQRMCTDQSFKVTWTGSNLTSVEFALSNTSDNWTSGWLTADPASGAFTAPVDHHGYDKVIAHVKFADGSTAQADADVGTCAEAPAPPPTVPPSQPAPSKPAPSQPSAVTSLPVTGTGNDPVNGLAILVALAAVAASGVLGFAVSRKPTKS
ncbi:MAG: hypothetical protein M9950_11280 [Thermomicrobiales bacterium]|nr:hypothetical protein [Thermomicrobiales bacterium]